MATSKEILAVMTILEKEWPEGTDTETVAKAALSALDKTRDTSYRPIGPPLKVGQPFRSIITDKTHVVAWTGIDGGGQEAAWIVEENSDHGWIGLACSPVWRWTSPVEDKGSRRRVKDADTGEWEKGKEALERLRESGNSYMLDDNEYVWRLYPSPSEKLLTCPVMSSGSRLEVGDKLTFRQDGQYEVLALAHCGALLRHRQTGHVWSDTVANIERYYKDGWKR